MNKFILMSQDDAKDHIAELFADSSKFFKCKIAVCEEHVFDGKPLTIGEISLQANKSILEIKKSLAASLISYGAFEWKIPTDSEMKKDLCILLKNLNLEKEKEDAALQVLRNLMKIAARSGTLHPTFDPQDIERMPLLGSTTVVADTSGALSGALDFIVRNFPAVRIKVPAIVHMEFVNMRNRVRAIQNKLSKSAKNQSKAQKRLLIDRLNGEGGTRVLLRLELQESTEVERTYLLGDPLRSAFQQDQEDGIKDLDIRKPQREYADRLILESARHHQAQSGPSHTVRLLTSDKLLASMALAEGISPMFVREMKLSDFFGQLLTGQTFDPFTGNLRRTSLLAILWELAFAFGEVQLKSDNHKCLILRSSFPKYPWSTYHVVDDLLWCAPPSELSSLKSADTPKSKQDQDYGRASEKSAELAQTVVNTSTSHQLDQVAFQRISVEKLIFLVCELDDKRELTQSQIMDLLDIGSVKNLSEYRLFLHNADLISLSDAKWRSTTGLKKLVAGLKSNDIPVVREQLLLAPSFKRFKSLVDSCALGSPVSKSVLHRASRTYTVLGEVTHLVSTVGQKGIFPTPVVPDVNSFVDIAMKRFKEINNDSGLVSTGLWLEALIRINGVHPEVAKRLLNDASEIGLLYRSTEGSTTQMRHHDHNIHVLRVDGGVPTIKKIHLYRGDYLVDGKASVSLRIKRVSS